MLGLGNCVIEEVCGETHLIERDSQSVIRGFMQWIQGKRNRENKRIEIGSITTVGT